MPHDGQALHSPLLTDLLDVTRAALPPVEAVLNDALDAMRVRIAPAGKIDATLLPDARQPWPRNLWRDRAG
jgi:(2S)-methylsuccinyl-CoA dehydrogenase